MNDLGVHLLLFLVISVAIVVCGVFYSEPDDHKALRLIPRRLAWFIGGSGILVAVILLIEHTVASVN